MYPGGKVKPLHPNESSWQRLTFPDLTFRINSCGFSIKEIFATAVSLVSKLMSAQQEKKRMSRHGGEGASGVYVPGAHLQKRKDKDELLELSVNSLAAISCLFVGRQL